MPQKISIFVLCRGYSHTHFPYSRAPDFDKFYPYLFPYSIVNFNPYMFRTRTSNFNPYMFRTRTSIFKIFRSRTVFRTHFQIFPYPVLIPFVLWVRNRYGVRKRSRTPEYDDSPKSIVKVKSEKCVSEVKVMQLLLVLYFF